MTKAVEAGASVTITERLQTGHEGLQVRYLGAPDTFVVEELTIGLTSCLAGPGSIPAEMLSVDWPQVIPRGTEVACRVRNMGRTSATFVAVIRPPPRER